MDRAQYGLSDDGIIGGAGIVLFSNQGGRTTNRLRVLCLRSTSFSLPGNMVN